MGDEINTMRKALPLIKVFESLDGVDKLCLVGDLHLRAQRPRGRIDDYVAAQETKFGQVLEMALGLDAPVLQSGDFFDSIDVPWNIVERYIRLIKEYHVKVYCVRGQHDLRYHSRDIVNTPLAVMEASGAVQVVGSEGIALNDEVTLFGCDWGEKEIPEPRGGNDILLIHRMIIKDRKLWPGQGDYMVARSFLSKHRFALVVSGDNHESFIEEFDGRKLVNCGSLMRSSVDQVRHRPTIYLYDLAKGGLSVPIYIRIDPSEEVFNLDGLQQIKEQNEDLENFVKELGEKKDLGLSFLDNLRIALETVEKDVRSIVEEALEEYA